MKSVRRIAITPGEPAGIGPDLCVVLSQRQHDCAPVVIGDPDLLMTRAEQLGLPLELIPFDTGTRPTPPSPGSLYILPTPMDAPVEAGMLNTANATAVLRCLDRAIAGCRSGHFDAMVTGPVHKGVINDAGIPFTGHTEYLAEKSGVGRVVMMLTADDLRVALATTHLPLRDVSSRLDTPMLVETLHILAHDLRKRFGIRQPKIAVCGLNPHAGEGGHLGDEEVRVIEPAIAEARTDGLDIEGPLPADTVFVPGHVERYDAILAMYHDQGLPVLKNRGFGRAINVTLGLPFIRTSVDHGTALDLAGSGRADAGSLNAALTCALEMAGIPEIITI